MAAFTTRPVVMGTRGVVTSGHYLATAAGFRIMEQGGNAIDAAAAMCFCLNVLEPASNGIGGEAPTLVYSAKEGKTFAISGMGWSPQDFTIDWCRENNIDLIPGDGFLPACVPAVVDTWATAVARFGTMSLSQVLQPAIELAENGFGVYSRLHERLLPMVGRFMSLYPTSADIYCPNGRVPEIGEVFRNPDLAQVMRTMCEAEARGNGKGRITGIEAARDAFYEGPIADAILEFATNNPVEDASGRAHAALMSHGDLAEWRASVEAPVSCDYRGLQVHKCPPWTQGPVFLQILGVVEGLDLPSLGHNSSAYLHTVIESTKLAFADREAYYGDPEFDQVPLDTLLSKEYASMRREMIEWEASQQLRPGDLGQGVPQYALRGVAEDNRLALGVAAGQIQDLGLDHAHTGDTTHLDAVDIQGNMVASTPSGGLDRDFPGDPRPGIPFGDPRPDVLPEPPASQRPGPAQAAAGHLDPHSGNQGRRAVHGVRHAGGRRPGAVDLPVFLELRGIRDGHPGGAGCPHGPLGPFSVVVLSPPGLSRQGHRRVPGIPPGGRGIEKAGAPGTDDRCVVQRQGHGYSPRQGTRSHPGRCFPQG